MRMVEGSPLDLAPCVFVNECLCVAIRGTSFSLLFKKLSKLFVEALSLGVRFKGSVTLVC